MPWLGSQHFTQQLFGRGRLSPGEELPRPLCLIVAVRDGAS